MNTQQLFLTSSSRTGFGPRVPPKHRVRWRMDGRVSSQQKWGSRRAGKGQVGPTGPPGAPQLPRLGMAFTCPHRPCGPHTTRSPGKGLDEPSADNAMHSWKTTGGKNAKLIEITSSHGGLRVFHRQPSAAPWGEENSHVREVRASTPILDLPPHVGSLSRLKPTFPKICCIY